MRDVNDDAGGGDAADEGWLAKESDAWDAVFYTETPRPVGEMAMKEKSWVGLSLRLIGHLTGSQNAGDVCKTCRSLLVGWWSLLLSMSAGLPHNEVVNWVIRACAGRTKSSTNTSSDGVLWKMIPVTFFRTWPQLDCGLILSNRTISTAGSLKSTGISTTMLNGSSLFKSAAPGSCYCENQTNPNHVAIWRVDFLIKLLLRC